MLTLWKQMGCLSAVALLFMAVQVQAADGDAAAGEKLYKESCMSCHKDKPGKMMGKPVGDLVAKMQKFKTVACPTGKVATMQKALQPMSDKQLTDIGTYLSGLK